MVGKKELENSKLMEHNLKKMVKKSCWNILVVFGMDILNALKKN